jgi:hypothetical protein
MRTEFQAAAQPPVSAAPWRTVIEEQGVMQQASAIWGTHTRKIHKHFRAITNTKTIVNADAALCIW